MTDGELDIIKQLSTIGGLAVIAWALRPLWSAIADWIRSVQGETGLLEKRIKDLEGFKANTKQNHFHDLEELKEDRRDVWNAISAIRKDLSSFQLSMENRLTKLETRVFNGQKQ